MFYKNLFFKKNNPFHITWTYIFIFGPNLAVSCTFNRNITSLRKLCTIWIYRNRAGTFLHFLQTLSKTLLVIVICNQKCMPSDLCGSDFYIWLAQTHFLKKKFMNSQTLCYLPKKCHGSHPRVPCKVSLAAQGFIDFFHHKRNNNINILCLHPSL